MKNKIVLILLSFVNITFGQSTLISPSQTEIKSVEPNILFNSSAGLKGLVGNVNGSNDIYLDVNAANPLGRLRFRTMGNTRLMIAANGNIMLGSSATPNAELHFPNNIANKRLMLWEDAVNDHEFYGFGINIGTLRYQVSNPTASHRFFASSLNGGSSKQIMQLHGSGSVRIGTEGSPATDPTFPLEIYPTVNGKLLELYNISRLNSWGQYVSNNGNLILVANGVNRGSFDPATGAYTQLSDRTAKKNIRGLDTVLEKVLLLNPSQYQYYGSSQNSTGFIAQELQTTFPDFVHNIEANNGADLLSVDYAGLSTIALKAIQEQQVLIKNLQVKIQILENKLK
jgi:trimeric autotransporter adhesin